MLCPSCSRPLTPYKFCVCGLLYNPKDFFNQESYTRYLGDFRIMWIIAEQRSAIKNVVGNGRTQLVPWLPMDITLDHVEKIMHTEYEEG
jgi:hypothetical protein